MADPIRVTQGGIMVLTEVELKPVRVTQLGLQVIAYQQPYIPPASANMMMHWQGRRPRRKKGAARP